MSGLLNEVAVTRQAGDAAGELLGHYLDTNPQMALNHTAEAAPAVGPSGPAAGPGAGGNTQAQRTARAVSSAGPALQKTEEFEIFKNGKNALAFFFYRETALDNSNEEGPFWFTIKGDAIVAGTEDHNTTFEGVTPALIETARQRGVIMLVEFEDQNPVRCTPCYLSDNF